MRYITGLLIPGLVFLAATLPPETAAQQSHAELAAEVDELMADYAGSDGPGAVVAVMQGGVVQFAKAYGLANLEHSIPLTRETVLDVGSVAKQFTSFAIVLLAQEGKLSLDADIRSYLPEVPDFGSTITVRHLVHHMSGLREIYTSEALAGYQAGDGIEQAQAQRLTSNMTELNFEPGTEHLYCNTGYMLLADIVAAVSGKTFPDFMAERVFGPVGMAHTSIMSRRGQVMMGAAESYGRLPDGGYRRIFDNSGVQGAGGIYTTIDDLAMWMSNYGTMAVGGPAAIEQMQQRGVLANGDTLVYAFGLTVTESRGLRVLTHGGSSAGFRASFAYFPELDGGVITMSNFAAFDGSIAAQVAEAAFGDHMSPAAERPSPTQSSDPEPRVWTPSISDLEALAGLYYSAELETVYSLTVEDGALMASHRRHGEFGLQPAATDLLQGASFFGTARIERDADGTPTGLRVSNGRVRNVLFVRVEG